jgi:hypothetical protein
MRKILDKGFTLRTEGGARRQPVGRVLGRPIVFRLMTLTLTAAVLTNINTTPSKADMNLKLYAYNLLTWQEFQCFNWLIHYESRWNPQAKNGSHYGLGQMRSTWYRDLSPQAQIKASIKYIHHRYKDSCDALNHFERKGWH